MRYQDQIAVVLAESIYSKCGVYVLPICVAISKLVNVMPINYGKSKYARRRRAIAIGRCVRCYRVSPPIGASKCNGVSCVPGITFNSRVAEHICEGVTEVIPLPDVAQRESCS